MEIVGSAVSSLIKNILPDDNQRYPTVAWVEEELQPLLHALDQRSTANHVNIASNATADSYIQIGLGAVMLLLLIITLITGYCIRNNNSVNARLSDGIDTIFQKIGTSAPNLVPDFQQ